MEQAQKKRRRYTFLKVKEVDQIKAKLLADQERILNQSVNEEEFYLKKEELSDPIDEASINTQTQQELRFKTRDNKYLQRVEKQLSRIEDSSFGECEECGEPIGFERLMARPIAEQCISCKEESEGDENTRRRISNSLGRGFQEPGVQA